MSTRAQIRFATRDSDLEFIYYIWQAPGKTAWISIFSGNDLENGMDYCGSGDNFKCIFVGTPEKLLTKYGSQLEESYYKLNTNNDG